MKYKEWLQNIKGYSNGTIQVYLKYSKVLESENRDYKKAILLFSDLSNSSKRVILSAFKIYLKFKGDPSWKDIELPKRIKYESGYVSFDQYKNYLCMINKKTKTGMTKYVLIRILFETGMRANEVVRIEWKDIHLNKIRVFGKGLKYRYVSISEWLNDDLMYLKKINMIKPFNFSYKNLYQLIKNLDKERKLHPHMFRHGYAKYCYQKGVPIYDISISMGHSSIDTTSKYINKNSYDVTISDIF